MWSPHDVVVQVSRPPLGIAADAQVRVRHRRASSLRCANLPGSGSAKVQPDGVPGLGEPSQDRAAVGASEYGARTTNVGLFVSERLGRSAVVARHLSRGDVYGEDLGERAGDGVAIYCEIVGVVHVILLRGRIVRCECGRRDGRGPEVVARHVRRSRLVRTRRPGLVR